ncbi:MAG TPA: hypothetical protein VLD67_14135, partial [Vicinamibacterales bacterium]|nr:hypothetical protein [Vicinamibacterales bacterium]
AGVVVTLLFLKPRVPERQAGQSLEDYWARTDVREAVIRVWFLLEGAGVLAAVAFVLSRLPLAALVMLLAIAVHWVHGPARFGRRHEWE